MVATFVFFHVGPDIEQAEMLVRSIRATNPECAIIQCSSEDTPEIQGVTRVSRSQGDPNNLMTYRLFAFASLGLTHPAIYLDTDMLVLAAIAPDGLLGEFDVALCRRDFDRELLHSGSQRGVDFPEHRHRPLGEVYPFVACATVTRSFDFWKRLTEILEDLDSRFHRWYGDQEAMRLWVEKESAGRFSVLPETVFGCLPEKVSSLDGIKVLHFKGHARKPLMPKMFDAIFGREQSTRALPEATYVVMTPPPNTKSAGITYLNSLTNYLRSIGKNVIQIYAVYPNEELHIWGSTEVPQQNHWARPWQGHWVKCQPGQLAQVLNRDRSIVIHGENQHFKWFEGLNVVRYYLHKNGALQKKGVPRPGEFKVTWHPIFCEDADFILSKNTFRGDLRAARDLDLSDRSLDLTYAGKAVIHGRAAARLKNTIELTRQWPSGDDEYFYLLSRTRYLYTYDSATSVIDDAIIMGAMPIIMDTSPFTQEEWRSSLDTDLAGCFCLVGEDYGAARSAFESARARFIDAAIDRDREYFSKLSEFCERVERRFLGNHRISA
jgi:hypothetical protein